MVSQTIGSRRQVWNGTAKKTPGGLQRSDLIMNKHRRIVSKKKSISSKKHNRLLEYGYGTEKGKFGFVKTGTKKRGKKGKKMRGGSPFSPAGIGESYMIKDVTPQDVTPQSRALSGGRSRSRGMAGGSGYRNTLDNAGNADWNGDNLVGGRRRRHRKMRGGTTSHHSLNPAYLNEPQMRALGAS
jgi:hypothetical protein